MGKKGNDTISRSVNFDRWIYDAITEIGDKKGVTFTYALHELLRPVLQSEGYSSGIGNNYKKSANKTIIEKPKKAANQ